MPVNNADFWTSFAQQAPGLVGVLIITYIFMRWGVKPFLDYLREQTASWQAFLKEQRELSNCELREMAKEIHSLGTAVVEVKTLLVAHDAWERESTANQKEMIEALKRRQRKTGQDA